MRNAFFAVLLACAVSPAPTFAGDLWPWARQSTPDPPPVPPFEIPTFSGKLRDFRAALPDWVKAPKIDGDAVFRTIVSCYPARSRWPIDIDLTATLRNTGAVDITGTTIGRSMVGIVARLPLYSDTEIDRERQREYERRLQTAKTVAEFIGYIAKRNAALRRLAIAAAMETRAQVRVREGITDADEQVDWLKQTVEAEIELMTAESAVQEARLKLVAQCRDDVADSINAYLSGLAQVPEDAKVGAGDAARKR